MMPESEKGRTERTASLLAFLLGIVCGIAALVGTSPLWAESEKSAGDVPHNAIRLAPETVKRSDIRTEPVQYRHLVDEIQTVGEVTYDERRVKVVTAWIGGRIDKLYVDFTGVEVQKGQALAEVYSPELVSTQQEYILALETRGKLWPGGSQEATELAGDLVTATRQRLRLWGITEEQIDRLEKTREVRTQMTIHAPIGGTVIHKRVNEGQYVKTGEELYKIADLSMVWAMVDIYEYEMAGVQVGQEVAITTAAYPGVSFTGKVSFIEPFLNTETRSVKVRMEVANPRLTLKPGMYVDARLKIPYQQRPFLSVPYTAVLDTGVRKLTYVELEEGVFKPVEVRIGPRTGDYLPVLAGLQEGQQVAVTANYLLDSQRTLGGAAGGYGGAIGGSHGGH